MVLHVPPPLHLMSGVFVNTSSPRAFVARIMILEMDLLKMMMNSDRDEASDYGYEYYNIKERSDDSEE